MNDTSFPRDQRLFFPRDHFSLPQSAPPYTVISTSSHRNQHLFTEDTATGKTALSSKKYRIEQKNRTKM